MGEILNQIPSHFLVMFIGVFVAIVCFNLDTSPKSNRIASFGLLVSVVFISVGIYMYFAGN
jgi:hypothetical protein